MDKEWKRHHPKDRDGVPSRLYTDENPSTTIKGTGFKDRATAERTIFLTSQTGVRYKQYWTIKSMHERARHHPHPTQGMKEAMEVFEKWFVEQAKQPPLSNEEQQERLKEWKDYQKLCASAANDHSYGHKPSVEDLQRARKDIQCAKKTLGDLLEQARRRPSKSKFKIDIDTRFPLTAFTALFGAPGIHGYGSHRIDIDCDDNTYDTRKAFSIITIHGMDGLLQLLPNTLKIVSLLGACEPETIVVAYNRRTHTANALIHYHQHRATIVSLWKKAKRKRPKPPPPSLAAPNHPWQGAAAAAAAAAAAVTTSSDFIETSSSNASLDDGCLSWTCEACTFCHSGSAKALFLSCEVCGTVRPPRNKKP